MEENNQQNINSIEVAEDQTVINDEHHYHHHHHHGSHHNRHYGRHRRRRSSGKKKKIVAFFKKNRSVLINVLSCTVSVVLLVIMALNIDFSKPSEPANSPVNVTQSTIQIEASIYPEKVLMVSDALIYYMDPNNDASANEVYKLFEGHKRDLNEGLPLRFTYRVTGLPNGVQAQTATLELSESGDYQEALIYRLDLDDTSIDIYNLKAGVKYYYRVNLTLDNAVEIGTTGCVETENAPRILNIDGTANVRDIGGWNTLNGQKIKQGLLYRGSEIDGAVQAEYKITDFGLQQMIGDLGIRFDMDLRSSSENKDGIDALGKNVVHKYYGIGMYSEILNNKEQLRELFSDLANPDNYPIYLHCTYGRDRTGTVCYLLEALLGVSNENLRKEYEISALTDSYVNTAEFNAFAEKISSFEGDTTQKKVESYLLSIGVTAEEISTIREIFLEQE